jgi:hypothetical protein
MARRAVAQGEEVERLKEDTMMGTSLAVTTLTPTRAEATVGNTRESMYASRLLPLLPLLLPLLLSVEAPLPLSTGAQ